MSGHHYIGCFRRNQTPNWGNSVTGIQFFLDRKFKNRCRALNSACKFAGFPYNWLATGGNLMKANIHPNYVEAIVKCACGETFKTRSTKPEIHLEICSKCHPFFTGKQKLVDTAGRVERFQRKYNKKA